MVPWIRSPLEVAPGPCRRSKLSRLVSPNSGAVGGPEEPATDLEVEVSWPIGPTLHPELIVMGDFGRDFMVEVEPCLASTYAWRDACAGVSTREHPPSWQLLSRAQRRAIARVRESWPETKNTLAQHVPKKLRIHMEWRNITVHALNYQGEARITLGGTCDPPRDMCEYSEHGLSAELHAGRVMKFCDDTVGRLRAKATPQVPPRRHPLHINLSPARMRELLNAGDWEGLRDALAASGAKELVAEVAASWWWQLPPETAIEIFDEVRPFFRRFSRDLTTEQLKSRPLAMTKAMVGVGACRIPRNPFRYDLDACLQDVALFRIFLELDVDPNSLVDRYGCLLRCLQPTHVDALRKVHPAFVADAEAEAQKPPAHAPNDVLERWVKMGWIELDEDANRGRVCTAVTSLIETKLAVEQLADALMEVPGGSGTPRRRRQARAVSTGLVSFPMEGERAGLLPSDRFGVAAD